MPRPRPSRSGISRSSSSSSRNTALRVAYVGSFGYHGLLSIDPNSIPAQICANASGLRGRRHTGDDAEARVPQGAQYIPGRRRARIRIWARGFFWYTEGNSSYNALQIDVTPPLEPRPAIPRQLHLVEESGHEFRR